jgi:hypothetical protein
MPDWITETGTGQGKLAKFTEGSTVHRVFATCGQEAFLQGHVHAFHVLGGIPRGRIRYDNLRAAVERVLGLGRSKRRLRSKPRTNGESFAQERPLELVSRPGE